MTKEWPVFLWKCSAAQLLTHHTPFNQTKNRYLTLIIEAVSENIAYLDAGWAISELRVNSTSNCAMAVMHMTILGKPQGTKAIKAILLKYWVVTAGISKLFHCYFFLMLAFLPSFFCLHIFVKLHHTPPCNSTPLGPVLQHTTAVISHH